MHVLKYHPQAGGLLNGIWGATHAENPSKMAEYKMQKDLKQMGDYLSCVMEGQVSNAVYKIEQRMDQQLIDSFNNAVNGIVTGMTRDCMQRNCLNFTNIEPSKRNEAAGASCMAAYTPITDCRNVTWNPRAPRLCKGSDSFGATYEGICSVDGQCYYSSVGFQGTIAYYRQIKATFENSPAILNFNAFNNLYSPAAVVAYAKAVPVYLAIMQELFLLGSATAEDAKMRAFVTEAAQWLQSRVEFHTNITKSPLMTVMDATDWAADPLRLRYSCKPEDLLDTVYACSSLSSFSTDKQVALMLTQKTGNSDKLCVEFDTTGDGQAMEPYRKRPDLFAVTTFNAQARSAASPLAAKNQKLFENAGVYSIIKTLGDMATAPNIMPPGSFKAYQDQFTPRLACTGPKPTLGATAIKPLGTWEAPDNLSKGSVVLKGVVIGGEAMQRVAAGNAPQAAVAAPKGARRLL